MTTTATPDVLAELDELIEYFSERADAEYHPDSTGASPNKAMQLQIAAQDIRTRIAALVEAAREVAGAFDVESGQFRSALKYSDYVALHAAIRRVGR